MSQPDDPTSLARAELASAGRGARRRAFAHALAAPHLPVPAS